MGIAQLDPQWGKTFEFVTTMALQYLSLAMADLNHKNASYVAFAKD